MTAINNVFLSAGLFPQLQAQGSRSGGGDEGNSDGFAAMFRRAAEGNRGSPEIIRGTVPRTDRTSLAKLTPQELPAAELLAELIEDEPAQEVPDELLALIAAVVPPVIQEQATDPPPAPLTTDTTILAASTTDATQVVSSLESNKEIDAPADNAAATDQEFTIPANVAAQEQTARMPQPSGQTEITEHDTAETKPFAETAESGVPCPLENENNKAISRDDTAPGNEKNRDERQNDQAARVFGQSQTVDISPERLHATEQLSRTAEAAPQTATVDSLYNTLVDSVFTASTSDAKFMEIQLKPEFLGKVAVQLTLGDAGLEIRIKAEDLGVKGLIADQITQLTSSLNDKGVKVSAVDVVFANVSDHSYNGGSSHQQDARKSKQTASGSINIGFGIGFTEDADGVSVVDTGIASVEYSV